MNRIQFPKFVYVPTYGLRGKAYLAGTPPNSSWANDEFGPNSAVFDSQAIEALDKIVTGSVTSWECIDTAELALRALILHENLYWLLPAVLVISPEIVNNGGYFSYEHSGRIVYPKYNEPESLLGVLQHAGAWSYSVYDSWLEVKENKPIDGDPFWVENYSSLISQDEHKVRDIFRVSLSDPKRKQSYFASPKAVGAASYFGSHEDRIYESKLLSTSQPIIPEKVLSKLDDRWRNEVCGGEIGLNILLGPFLAIVLSRAKSRDNIPSVITELRNEFQGARLQLWEYFDDILKEKRLLVAKKKLATLNRAIESIIPAAFPENDRPFSFLWSATHAIAEMVATMGLSIVKLAGEEFLKRNVHWSQVSSINVTKMLTQEMKKTDLSLIEMLKKHLTAAELKSLNIT